MYLIILLFSNVFTENLERKKTKDHNKLIKAKNDVPFYVHKSLLT